MKKLAVTFLIVSASILSGCASGPSDTAIKQANFGTLPTDYQSSVKDELSDRLKDPDSAKFTFLTPSKAWCQSGFTYAYGWLIPLTVNAKNSFGGYTGKKPMAYMYTNGVYRDFTAPYQVGGCKPVS